MPETLSEQINKHIEFWRSRLIDLTKRNRLLFYRRSKFGSLKFLKPEVVEIFKELIVEEKKMKIWQFPPEKNKEEKTEQNFFDLAQSEINPAPASEDVNETAFLESCLEKKPLKTDEILTDKLTNKELLNTLLKLHRRYVTEYTEKGISVLHVVFGFLEWREPNGGPRITSPLVLCPVRIARKNIAEAYSIELSDDEVAFNPALHEKLKQDFNLELPDLPEEIESLDLGAYFEKIRRKVKHLDWNVLEAVEMSVFSFHKIAMYNELKIKKDFIAKHPIVGLLAGERSADEFLGEEPMSAEELDNISESQKLFHVLDADSSQQVCIEEALRGKNFVIEGPPGTGKSQTIANIMCKFIEAGKSVLFVSEKMAALEVVFNRLKEIGLNSFCMELHSHKANKKEVIEELSKCLSEKIVAETGDIEGNIARLLGLKKQLKAYVTALHSNREPLGLSAYEVISKLAALEDVPYVPCGISDISNITLSKVNYLEDIFFKTKYIWNVAKQGERFVWHGCVIREYNMERKELVADLLKGLVGHLKAACKFSNNIAKDLNLNTYRSPSNAPWNIALCHLLERGVSIPARWLIKDDVDELIRIAEEWRFEFSKYQKNRNEIMSNYDPSIFNQALDVTECILNSKRKLCSLLRSDNIDLELSDALDELINCCNTSSGLLEDWHKSIAEVVTIIGFIHNNLNVSSIKKIAEGMNICFLDTKPKKIWLDDDEIAFISKFILKYGEEFQKQHQIKAKLAEKYKDEYMSLDLISLKRQFTKGAAFRSWFRIFLPSFHRTIRNLKAVSKSNKTDSPKEIYEDLCAAESLISFENELKGEEEKISTNLGLHYAKYNTDFQGLQKDLDRSKKLLALFRDLKCESGNLNAKSLLELFHELKYRTLFERLSKENKQWQDMLIKQNIFLPLDNIIGDRKEINELSIKTLINWFHEVCGALLNFKRALDPVISKRLPGKPTRFLTILDDLGAITYCQDFEKKFKEKSAHLLEIYDFKYEKLNTKWSEILDALKWTKELKPLLAGFDAKESFFAAIITAREHSVKSKELSECNSKIVGAIKEVNALFEGSSHISTNDAFEQILAVVEGLLCQIEELKDWVDYVKLIEEIQDAGCWGLFERIVKSDIEVSDVKDVVRKAVFQACLDQIIKSDTTLSNFRSDYHEDLLSEYQALDKRLNQLSRNLVIASVNEKHPGGAYCSGSQIGILRREAAKKRRKKPLRKLFAEIPELVLNLKRCFLMSPLSVTHYLDPSIYRFDAVIFDEASQIFPEDAVAAISRGTQVIVVGDRKQLPPTAFFKDTEADDYDEDIEIEQIEELPSILDSCWASGLRTHLLKWHYRSKHEELITFSNRSFYENKLITFPANRQKHEELGVKFCFVENGIYERGERKINLAEAEKVVELVTNHFKKYPQKTLGIVALSLAQRDAIESLLELKLKDSPYYEKISTQDRLGGFFVKNLESVQGDERDVIIISVGYGKDKNGKLTMNFGPINREEGWRRLNVLITRARERCIVVSSIKASDINLTSLKIASLKHFHRFLNYAENGLIALNDLNASVDGEAESPFEESVAYALERMGYDVIQQVGCSGFRIDIGILDPDRPGTCLLGVECDGATYHSIKSTRDRDRLRQAVLEDMGWRIYRIWSTDWIYHRQREEEKLKLAIENARKGTVKKRDSTHDQTVPQPKKETILNGNGPLEIPGAETYLPYSIPRIHSANQFFSQQGRDTTKNMMCAIIDHESPIHIHALFKRVLDAWGISRMGSRIVKELHNILRHIMRWESETYEKKGKFLFCRNSKIIARQAHPSHSDSYREIEIIHDEEIKQAIVLIVEKMCGVSQDGLIKSVASFFGILRTSEEVGCRIADVLDCLLSDEVLKKRDEQIILANNNNGS